MTDSRKEGLIGADERQPGTALVPFAADTDPSAAHVAEVASPGPAQLSQESSGAMPMPEAGAAAVAAEAPSPLPADARQESPDTTSVSEAGAIAVAAEAGEVTPLASAADVEPEAVEDDTPGWFSKPQILGVQCLHEFRLPEGRTLVTICWGGWGWVNARAELDGQVFHRRLRYAWPEQRVIDLLVPMGATLTVTVRNAWGSDSSTLQVLASEPMLPVIAVPPAPDVIGVRMPRLKLPPAPSTAIARLIPSQLGGRVISRRPLPAINDRLRHAIALESRRISRLPAMFGAAQHYQREKLSPTYGSLRVGDVNMVPVRDRLRAWMVEIHGGEDETEGG